MHPMSTRKIIYFLISLACLASCAKESAQIGGGAIAGQTSITCSLDKFINADATKTVLDSKDGLTVN